MTSAAITLVLLSAFFHALWNSIAKRAVGGAVFVWLITVIEVIFYIPVMPYTLLIEDYTITWTAIGFMVGSAFFHVSYFLLLTKGYSVGDLSIVYPLARGIGPLIATVVAIAIFSERPTPLALFGSACICVGVVWLTGDPRKLRSSEALPGIAFASLTGVVIAGYTLWDSYAVSQVMVPVLIYQWGLAVSRTILITPLMLRQRHQLPPLWQMYKRHAAIIGLLSPLSYALMLAAFTLSPISYVAPLRTISVLIGVLIGTQMLNEGNTWSRLGAASVMVLGVIALGLG